MQKDQKQTNESLRKGYDQAKVAVKNLREKNSCLKTELKIEQDRNVQLEEQLAKMKDGKLQESSPQLDDKQGSTASPASQMQTLQDVISRLESEKVTLMTENCKLEDHISCLKAMREDEQVRELSSHCGDQYYKPFLLTDKALILEAGTFYRIVLNSLVSGSILDHHFYGSPPPTFRNELLKGRGYYSQPRSRVNDIFEI